MIWHWSWFLSSQISDNQTPTTSMPSRTHWVKWDWFDLMTLQNKAHHPPQTVLVCRGLGRKNCTTSHVSSLLPVWQRPRAAGSAVSHCFSLFPVWGSVCEDLKVKGQWVMMAMWLSWHQINDCDWCSLIRNMRWFISPTTSSAAPLTSGGVTTLTVRNAHTHQRLFV